MSWLVARGIQQIQVTVPPPPPSFGAFYKSKTLLQSTLAPNSGLQHFYIGTK